MALVTLIEATPWNAATGAPVAVRLAGGGRRHYTHKGFNDWRGGVLDRPRVTSRLGFDDGGFTGGAIPTVSAIGFMPSRPATAVALAALHWKGATITVSTGDDAVANPVWEVELQGAVAGYTTAGGLFSFTVSSLAGGLAGPLAPATYAGTGGLECVAAAAGRHKRRSWGPCWNVEGRLADGAANLWEFGDPAFPLEAFDQVKDKGRAGPLVLVTWQGSAVATLAALTAATAPTGGGAVAPSIARVKWWTTPSGPLTADLRGEIGDGGYFDTIPAIAARVASVARVREAPNTGALIAARPDAAGLHIDSPTETAAAALDRLLLPASLAWGMTPAGAMDIAPIAFADPVADLVANTADREAAFAPLATANVGYRRNHRRHGDGEISAAILAADVTYNDGRTAQEMQPATPGATAGAPIGTTIGGVVQPDGTISGGRPVASVVAALDKIAPVEAATELLKKANLDAAAIQRQAGHDAAKLAEALTRLTIEANGQRVMLRDASITVNPADGTVRIAAIDQVLDRTSKVEIGLSAATAQIALRATNDYVNQQIALAQLNPGQAADLEAIIRRITAAEIAIDGNRATIALKADAMTVTTLTGVVSSVTQTLEALAGVVATKASQTMVDALGVRVGSAEQLLASYGNVSTFAVELRQARLRDAGGAEATLRAILAGDDARQFQIVAAAQARQELTAKVDDGLAAEALSRLALTVRIAEADARLATESLTRAGQTDALARSTAALQASFADLSGTVTQQAQAIADGDRTSATLIGQVSARIGDFGLVSVQQAFAVLADRTGRLEGSFTLAISTNGRLQGYVLAGSASGPASFSFIDTDLRMGTGRVIFDNGTFMQVNGVGFGAAGNLVEWFGPSMPIGQCSTANGRTYKTTTGAAYFGGGLSAGVRHNARQSTELAPDAAIVVGPFGTAGNRKTIVASYSYEQRREASTNGSVTGRPEATLVLERRFASTDWVELTRFTAAGETEYQAPLPGEPGFGRQAMSAAATFTDNSPEPREFTYRLRLANRQSASFNFTSPNAGTERQNLSLSSVEE